MIIHRALLLAAILVMLLAGVAHADDAPPPPPMIPDGEAVPAEAVPPGTTYERGIRSSFDNASSDPYAPAAAAAPCAPAVVSPCAEPSRRRGYGGFNLQAYPGLGFGVETGVWFARSRNVDWAAEIGLSYQDMTDGFNAIANNQAGKWTGCRLGVKGSFLPSGSSHPTFRAGLAWNVETGDAVGAFDFGNIPPNGPNRANNFFGGYVGLGWEWDLAGGLFTTGPEIFGFAGWPDQGWKEALTVTLAWHFIVNF